VAAGGRWVSECLCLYHQNVAPLFEASCQHNVIAFHAGDNDIGYGWSADHTYSAFRLYVAMAHRQGWQVVVSTELLRPDMAPAHQRELEAYNAQLRRNEAGVDAVVDFDADPRMTDPACRRDPALFTDDGVHPSDGGDDVMAGMLAPAVKQMTRR